MTITLSQVAAGLLLRMTFAVKGGPSELTVGKNCLGSDGRAGVVHARAGRPPSR